MTNEDVDRDGSSDDSNVSAAGPPDPRTAIPEQSPPDPSEQLAAVKPSQQSRTDTPSEDPPLVESTPANGTPADGALQANFWVLVLFVNVALLALTAGVLAWYFDIGQGPTLILLGIGAVAVVGGVRRYRQLNDIRHDGH